MKKTGRSFTELGSGKDFLTRTQKSRLQKKRKKKTHWTSSKSKTFALQNATENDSAALFLPT